MLQPDTLAALPPDIDAAYYLVHSMSGDGSENFFQLEQASAQHFTYSTSTARRRGRSSTSRALPTTTT